MLIYLSLLVALIGAVIYFVASKAEMKEIGRLAYAVGLLAFLLKSTESMLKVP